MQSVFLHFSILKAAQFVFEFCRQIIFHLVLGRSILVAIWGLPTDRKLEEGRRGDLTLELLVLTSNPIACFRGCRGRFHPNFPPDYLSDWTLYLLNHPLPPCLIIKHVGSSMIMLLAANTTPVQCSGTLDEEKSISKGFIVGALVSTGGL